MKIVNMVKLREEVDYESLCRKLENQVDLLTAEVERQQKLRDNDKCQLENQLKECQGSLVEMKKNLDTRSEFLETENIRLEVELKDILDELRNQKDHNDLMQGKVALLEKQNEQYQLENSAYQKVLAETTQMYEKKIAELIKQIEENHSCAEHAAEELDTMKKLLNDHQKSTKIQGQEKIDELRERLQGMSYLHETTANELQLLQSKYQDLSQKEVTLNEELNDALQRLYMEEKQRKAFENELIKLKKNVLETKNDVEMKENSLQESLEYANCIGSLKSKPSKETISCQKAALAKICKEVGFQRILELLKSEDLDIQIHALKVIANLAAEDINQERIVEEGGLDALLTLLQSSKNTTILRVASGAIANLAMNEINQGLIVSKGGTRLLAETASRAVDPQTLRMVAGALANLCGNESLHMMLNEDGGIKALLEMVTCGNTDVVAQVARGIANFAKCEFKGIIQGQRKGCSVLVEHGALSWLIANSNTTSASTRRHIELALCHLAQNEDNVKEFISNGGVKELVRISVESTREDIRNLAQRTLRLNPDFQAEVNAQQFY